VHAVAHQQNRALRFADQFHGLGDLTGTRPLVDEAIPVGRQGFCHIEFFEDDV
jgi:hypothetical protein